MKERKYLKNDHFNRSIEDYDEPQFRYFFTLWVLFLFQIIISNMDLKEVYGVYGKPHRMFIQAMLTRGIIASGELKKLFELIMKRCGG